MRQLQPEQLHTLAGVAATVGSVNEQDSSAGSAPVNAPASVSAWFSHCWYAVGCPLCCTAWAATVSCRAASPAPYQRVEEPPAA